jgi:hypothetical protein
MQPPDTMDVSMRLDQLLFTWTSTFNNRHYGETDDVVAGKLGTLVRHPDGAVHYLPERKQRQTAPDKDRAQAGERETVSDDEETQLHLQNFIDCVRSRAQPHCPFEIGFRSAIACQMAVASYRQGRTVTWEAKGEMIR